MHEGLGAADCVGSGYLVRRKALDDIGGIPTVSISEDTGTSAMLLGHGWTVAFIDEYLQCGEMPDSLLGRPGERHSFNSVQTLLKHCPGFVPSGLGVSERSCPSVTLILVRRSCKECG